MTHLILYLWISLLEVPFGWVIIAIEAHNLSLYSLNKLFRHCWLRFWIGCASTFNHTIEFLLLFGKDLINLCTNESRHLVFSEIAFSVVEFVIVVVRWNHLRLLRLFPSLNIILLFLLFDLAAYCSWKQSCSQMWGYYGSNYVRILFVFLDLWESLFKSNVINLLCGFSFDFKSVCWLEQCLK